MGYLVGVLERLGNRLVAGVLAAALIEGFAHWMEVDPARRRRWQLFMAGAGTAGTLGAGRALRH